MRPMSKDSKKNAEDWKSGTESLALCMICGGEYEADTPECPDCRVSLSVVRRCPNCHRIVSAKHTRCVYCRSSFTHELPVQPDSTPRPATDGKDTPGAGARRFRAAAVSIITFLLVFSLGMFFLRQINKPAYVAQIIARSKAANSLQLRRSPSLTSSIVGTVMPGATINLTGYQETNEGRWMAVDWNHGSAYLPTSDLSAPRAVDAGAGADALKFYLQGMDSPNSVDDAVKAVDYYARTFPGKEQGEELRWVLAEQIRTLSQHGGSDGAALRHEANQQYEQLVASNGKFAGKAKDALARVPSVSAPEREHEREIRTRVTIRRPDGLQVIGGSGTSVSFSDSQPHEALVLTQAQIFVQTGKLSSPAAGTVITGHVTRPIKANGIVVIPAGAACQMTVASSEPGAARMRLALTSIEIDHRAYAVKATEISNPSNTGTAADDRALSFRLNAPLVIER